MIENQNKQIQELTEKVAALEEVSANNSVADNDETLGQEGEEN